MSRVLLRSAVFAAAAARVAAAEGVAAAAATSGAVPAGAVAAAQEKVLLGEGTCTSGFTFSGFTNTSLNGDYIAVYDFENKSVPWYYKDGAPYLYPYGIVITAQPHSAPEHYIPGKNWAIYFGQFQSWDVLLAWCVPGVDGCPEVPETGLWPASVGLMKWNVVVDPNTGYQPAGTGPPAPPNKTNTNVNPGVSASCCKWTSDKCLSCNCDQPFPFQPTCTRSPFSSNTCRKDCCAWSETGYGIFTQWMCLKKGIFRHCNHSSAITNAGAVTKQSEFIV